ncbi:FliH/SctL family protein [Sphingomonas sp. LHG3443-2]|uniref:FliH/SctL family protein n=1 Tax=Sphingomonas sp. LHG3443-2 TaxID=2804639 RepID=UPI003CEE9B36
MSFVQPFAFAAEFHDGDFGPVTLASLELEVAELHHKLAQAHERGLRQGREEALATLRAERDTALASAAEALTVVLASLDARFATTERQVARLGAELALDLADQLAGTALERDPVSPIEAMIGRALEQVRRGCPLRVRVAPGLVSAVEGLVQQRQDRDRRRLKITVLADDSIIDGDARIEWDEGALLLDRAGRRAAMEAEIAASLAA